MLVDRRPSSNWHGLVIKTDGRMAEDQQTVFINFIYESYAFANEDQTARNPPITEGGAPFLNDAARSSPSQNAHNVQFYPTR